MHAPCEQTPEQVVAWALDEEMFEKVRRLFEEIKS